MAKPPSSAIGIDVGRHAIKAVRLQRRGADRLALTHFAVKEIPDAPLSALSENLKSVLKEIGASAKGCGIAFSAPETMVRIIEQNTIPPELLRDALRINGPMLLSQDCREWVLDCQAIVPAGAKPAATAAKKKEKAKEADQPAEPAAAQPPAMERYLVGGLPRPIVKEIHEAALKNKLPDTLLQLPPIALFNGFEYACPEVFHQEPFVLVDVGHRVSTVIVGVQGELVLIRNIDYGGAALMEALVLQGAANFDEAIAYMQEEEVLTVENARLSLGELVRTVSSSIGFFEAQRDQSIPKVYLSGGIFKLPAVLKLLNEELRLPCEIWNPFGKSELILPKQRSAVLGDFTPLLATAFGVAAEILRGNK